MIIKFSDLDTKEDTIYFGLICAGLLILLLGLCYCFSRVCCYSCWARCCTCLIKDKSKENKKLAKKIALKDRTVSIQESWRYAGRGAWQNRASFAHAQSRRGSDLSFVQDLNSDDEILYNSRDHQHRDSLRSNRYSTGSPDSYRRRNSFSGSGYTLEVPSFSDSFNDGSYEYQSHSAPDLSKKRKKR